MLLLAAKLQEITNSVQAAILKSPLYMPFCSTFTRPLTFQNVHCRT